MIARRCASNGLKPSPCSFATSSRRRRSRRTNVWWNFRVELAEPLHRQSRGRDDERAVRPVRPEKAREDETGLDRLAEADLVREEPADRIARRRPLGHVQLVRKDADAPAEERSESAGLADLREEEAVHAVAKRRRAVRLQRAEAVDRVVGGRERPEERGRDDASVREARGSGTDLVDDDRLVLALEPRLLPFPQRHRAQGRVVGRERQARLGGREPDDDPPPVHLLDAPGAEVGVELVEELVVFAEDRHGGTHGARRHAPGQGPFF